MQTEQEVSKQQVSFYGKKLYCLNIRIAKKTAPEKKEAACLYEDIEKNRE